MPYFTPPSTPELSLFYTTHGPTTAPPILLIHGWCCDSHDWNWQIPFLSQKYHVIALDLRGHGHSSAPQTISSYMMEAFAADAAALSRHLGYEKDLIVIGHSMGAVTTSVLSIKEPELVKAIVLLDPPYWQASARNAAIMPSVRAFSEPELTEWTVGYYKALLYPEGYPEHLATWYTRRIMGMSYHANMGCLEALCGDEGWASLEVAKEQFGNGKRAPRLVVYAKPELAELEKELGVDEGRGDEVATIEGVGHWPHQMKSEEVNELLGKWLEKL